MILGLHIGLASCGWCLINETHSGAAGIVDAGVRVFPMGMEMDIFGRTESRNLNRHERRLQRRLLDRRAMRKAHVRKMLVLSGMAPSQQLNPVAWQQFEHMNPYELRAKGLDERLTPPEFGRAIYHLAQRRGFKSNRKTPPKADEDRGKVAEATSRIEAEMKAGGFRSLGEYFNSIQSGERRIRGKYTLRKWYVEEFNALWDKQQTFMPDICTDDLRKELFHTLFFQNPLKKQKHLIGQCLFEPRKKRSRLALPEVQRFRLLQQVNNLRVEETIGTERMLTPEERLFVLQYLEEQESAKFSKLRTLLGLKRTVKFNLERGGADNVIGNVTGARIGAAIGMTRWKGLSPDDQRRMINDLMSIDDPEMLARRASAYWQLDEITAETLSEVVLEKDYGHLSLSAVRKLLSLMETGAAYMTAVQEVYPAHHHHNWAALDFVPPFPDLRNPLLQRALAETRRVVNAVIRKYGKPDTIRLELARDLKKSAKVRIRDRERMRKRKEERSAARTAMRRLMDHSIPDPKPADIEKWLLHKECGGICPYTGKAISESALFGVHPQFEVEYIIPFSRSLDNSFANKALCCVWYNRNVKKNRTPYEAAADTAGWNDIIQRVEGFKGGYAKAKRRRFLMADVPDDQDFLDKFNRRDLAVTRYATRAAAQVLQRLYTPQEAPTRVQFSPEQAPALLKRAWRINNILSAADVKTREDHRQHAINATLVALTSPAAIQSLAGAPVTGRAGAFPALPPPWPSFHEELSAVIGRMNASHRLRKKTNGPLHRETHYGFIHDSGAKGEKRVVLRKFLQELTKPEVDRIVDKAVREAVQNRLRDLGEADPSKAFKDRLNHPFLEARDGRRIPIHRARVYVKANPYLIEDTPGVRRVELRNNHHAEFFEGTDEKGQKRLRGEIITMLDVRRSVAKARQAGVTPTVVRAHDENGCPLAFSLASGDVVALDWNGERVICVVQKLSGRDYNFKRINDARPSKNVGKDRIRVTSDTMLSRLNVQKLMMDPLGNTYRTRD